MDCESLKVSISWIVGNLGGFGLYFFHSSAVFFSSNLFVWCHMIQLFGSLCLQTSSRFRLLKINTNSCYMELAGETEQEGYISSVIPGSRIPGEPLHKRKLPAES